MAANSVSFSPGAIAQGRFVVLGPQGALYRRICDSVRSLQETEFVAVDELFDGEVSLGTSAGVAIARARQAGNAVPDPVAASVVRHWFWSRKAARGFVLAGFPASVAQAGIFDAWLEERDIALSAVVWIEDPSAEESAPLGNFRGVADYYRERGLLVGIDGREPADEVLPALSGRLAELVADR